MKHFLVTTGGFAGCLVTKESENQSLFSLFPVFVLNYADQLPYI